MHIGKLLEIKGEFPQLDMLLLMIPRFRDLAPGFRRSFSTISCLQGGAEKECYSAWENISNRRVRTGLSQGIVFESRF